MHIQDSYWLSESLKSPSLHAVVVLYFHHSPIYQRPTYKHIFIMSNVILWHPKYGQTTGYKHLFAFLSLIRFLPSPPSGATNVCASDHMAIWWHVNNIHQGYCQLRIQLAIASFSLGLLLSRSCALSLNLSFDALSPPPPLFPFPCPTEHTLNSTPNPYPLPAFTCDSHS